MPMAAATRRGSAARIGSKPPTSRSPISQRAARYTSAKSARYCAKRISAERNAFSVTPASRSTVVDMARPGEVASM